MAPALPSGRSSASRRRRARGRQRRAHARELPASARDARARASPRRVRGAAPSLQAGGAGGVARLPRAAPHGRTGARSRRHLAVAVAALCGDGLSTCASTARSSPSCRSTRIARDPGRLARFGIFGCEAAGALAAVTAGRGRACPARLRAPIDPCHPRDPSLARGSRLAEPCASCSIRAVCKGGCKVVTPVRSRCPASCSRATAS